MTQLITPLVIFLIVAYILYDAFIKDDIARYINKKNALKQEKSDVDKLVKVVLLSDSIKEIEEFIAKNVSILSNEWVDILVERIQSIKNDKIISGESLSSKIEGLSKKSK